jgi:hypothetical protein
MHADAPETPDDCRFMNIETPQQRSAPIANFSPPLEQAGLFTATRQWIVRMSTTRANGQAGLAADVAISIVLLGAGLWRGNAGPVAAIFTMLLGLVLFSFIEYGFHRSWNRAIASITSNPTDMTRCHSSCRHSGC